MVKTPTIIVESMCAQSLSVVSDLSGPHDHSACQLLCPYNFPRRILEQIAILPKGIFPIHKINLHLCIFCTGRFFTTSATWKVHYCWIACLHAVALPVMSESSAVDPMDCTHQAFPRLWGLQAEQHWNIAMLLQGSSQPQGLNCISYVLLLFRQILWFIYITWEVLLLISLFVFFCVYIFASCFGLYLLDVFLKYFFVSSWWISPLLILKYLFICSSIFWL